MFKPGLVRFWIDNDQGIAGFDVISFLEVHLQDHAIDLRFNVDGVVSDDRADAGQIDRHIAHLGRGYDDRHSFRTKRTAKPATGFFPRAGGPSPPIEPAPVAASRQSLPRARQATRRPG